MVIDDWVTASGGGVLMVDKTRRFAFDASGRGFDDGVWSLAVSGRVVKAREVLRSLPRFVGSDALRGRIFEFSRQSRRRMVTAFNRCDFSPRYMFALTMPKDFVTDGVEVKRLLDAVRRELRRDKNGCLWFMEFQSRGAVHIHIFLEKGMDEQRFRSLMRIWCEGICRFGGLGPDEFMKMFWWHCMRRKGKGLANFQKVRRPEAAAVYAAKYASKGDQKSVPVGYRSCGRFWGMSRGRVIPWRVATLSISDVVRFALLSKSAYFGNMISEFRGCVVWMSDDGASAVNELALSMLDFTVCKRVRLCNLHNKWSDSDFMGACGVLSSGDIVVKPFQLCLGI